MKLERLRPAVFRLTLHTYELAALIAAARWAAEKDNGELPAGSVEQLRQVLARYDEATRRLDASGASPERSLKQEWSLLQDRGDWVVCPSSLFPRAIKAQATGSYHAK